MVPLRGRFVLPYALLVVGGTTACDGAPTAPPTPVAVVEVSAPIAEDALLVGGTVQLQAVPRAAGGAALSRSVTWTSSDPAVATVSSAGLVTAVNAGLVAISAQAGGVTGTVGLSVRLSVPVPSADAAAPATAALPGNTLSLRIPPGATTLPSVTAGRALLVTNDPRVLAFTAFVIGPTGATFSPAITAEVRVDLATIPAGRRAGLRLFRVATDGTLTGIAASAVDLGRGVVTSPIDAAGTYVVVQPGDPALLAGAEGTSRRVPVGTAVPGIGVIARDAAGNPVPGATIAFRREGGTGTLVGDTIAVTGLDGRADLPGQWIAGPAKGTYALRAQVAGSALSVVFSATAFAPAVAVRFDSAPTSGLSGVALPAPLVLRLVDADGAQAEVTQDVTLSLIGGSGTLTGTRTASAVLGGAILPGLTISGPGTYRLVATSAGLQPDTSAAIEIGQEVAFLEVTTPPAGAASGVPFTTQPVLQLLDHARLPVSGGAYDVTASLASSGVLLGTRTVRAVGGVATFTDLAIEGVGGARLSYQASGGAQAMTDHLDVAPAPPGVRLLVGNLLGSWSPGQEPTMMLRVDLSTRGTADVGTLDVTVEWDAARFAYVGYVGGAWSDSAGRSGVLTIDDTQVASGRLRFTGTTPGATTTSFLIGGVTLRVQPLPSGSSVETLVRAVVNTATNAAGTPLSVTVLPLTATLWAP